MNIVPLSKLVLDAEEQEIFDAWLQVECVYWYSDLLIQSEYEMYDHCISVPTKDRSNTLYVRYGKFVEFMKEWYRPPTGVVENYQ